MKIHAIEIKNLNSLYGSHTVDLSGDLHDAPIFLIVGPTGSGKSTILDAIFLALFGQTPRLNRQSGRNETDARMIMSQGTGTCRAAVIFSKLCPDGTRARYRAIWSCNRAHKKPRGRFQDPERSLERLDEDNTVLEILVSDKRNKYIAGPFSKVLEGLTVDDFQRSMILAQGEFAAFLKADERDRATILERLTDTSVYKRIGQRAAAHMRARKEELATLKVEAEHLELLPAEEVARLTELLIQTREQEDAQKIERAVAERAVTWAERDRDTRLQLERAERDLGSARLQRDARAEDRRRLEQDRHLRPAVQLLTRIRRIEADSTRRTQELEAHRAEIGRITQERPRVARAAMSAQDRLADHQQLLERVRPLLQQARLDTRELDRAKRELDTASNAAQLAEGKARDALTRRAAQEEAVKTAQRALDDARVKLEALVSVEPLVQVLGELQADYNQLTRERRALTERDARREELHARSVKLETQITALRDALTASGDALAPLEEARDAAERELKTLLGESPDSQARRAELSRQFQRARDRETALEKAQRRASEFADVKRQQLELGEQKDELEMALMAITSRIATEEARYGELSDAIGREQTHMNDVLAALSMAEQRRTLTAGDPCPLCGGTDHPYVASAEAQAFEERFAARRDELDRRIAQLEVERGALGDAMDALRIERTRAETTLTERQRQLKALTPRRAELMEELATLLATAGLPTAVRPDAIQNALDDSRRELQDTADAMERLSDSEGRLRQTERDLIARHKATEGQRAELQALEVRLSEANTSSQRLNDELQAQHEALDQRLDALITRLRNHGLASDAEPDLVSVGEALHEGHALKERLEDATQARELTRADLQLARARQEQLQALWEQADAAFKDAAARREQRNTEVQALRDRLNGCEEQVRATVEASGPLPPPDQLERRLEERIKEARSELEAAKARAITLQREHDNAQTLIAERQRQITEDAEALTEHRAQLDELLEGRTEAHELDQLTDTLLTDAERKRLSGELEVLDKAVDTATARVELSRQALTAHQDERPDEVGEAFELVASKAALAATRDALEATVRETLRLQGILTRQEERAESFADLQQRLTNAQTEYEVAYEIHKLIGVNDGDSFRQYAQILNLQELIDRANARLRWLNPRYSLVTGLDKDDQPRLGFAVRDSHYAQKERPLTTLSGGETFIVSLALALALADFRTIDMPIETLLLDEGLGTLDAEVLSTVMSALERLHGGGTQIGIISHVEGLKERVEARIVVEKQGGGRSWLRFELGDGT